MKRLSNSSVVAYILYSRYLGKYLGRKKERKCCWLAVSICDETPIRKRHSWLYLFWLASKKEKKNNDVLLSGTYMNKDLYKIREFFQVKARFLFFFLFSFYLTSRLSIFEPSARIYYFNFSRMNLAASSYPHTQMTAENAFVILGAPCHRRLRPHYSKKGFHRWKSISHMPTMFLLLLLLLPPPKEREIDIYM